MGWAEGNDEKSDIITFIIIIIITVIMTIIITITIAISTRIVGSLICNDALATERIIFSKNHDYESFSVLR